VTNPKLETRKTLSGDTPPSKFGALTAQPQLVNETTEAPKGSRRLRLALVLGDIGSLVLAWPLACALTADSRAAFFSRSFVGYLPIMVVITWVMIASNKLYKSRVCSVRAMETAALLRACAFAGVTAFLVAPRLQAFPRVRTMLLGQVLAFVFVYLSRVTYRAILRRARGRGRFMRPVVIIGTGDEAYELQRMVVDEPELGYEVLGVIGRAHEVAERPFSVPYLGSTADAVRIIREVGATGAIVGASSLSFRELNNSVRSMLEAGIHVQVSGGLLGFEPSRLRSNPIGREAAFYLEQVQLTGWQSRIKRVLDIVIASIALIFAGPIIGLFAFLIKREDKGPAFFKQQRVGLNGELFKMIKLRTMCVDAEAKLAELLAKNQRSGPLFKMENDPRFTRIGRLMDATSINELPQLWNVLKGEMSLVGPRPALAREVATFNDRLLMRHRVKPGITGLWQVESRDDPSFADYERCDVFYVENWSVRLDLMIILQTFMEVAKRAGKILRKSEPQIVDEDESPSPIPAPRSGRSGPNSPANRPLSIPSLPSPAHVATSVTGPTGTLAAPTVSSAAPTETESQLSHQ
jgi:exopolysaccharide biosynthesis polyprenyl glycosylphosphotransferase